MPFSQRQHEGADIKVVLFGASPPTDVNGTMPLHFEEIVTQKLDDIVQQLSSLRLLIAFQS